MRRTGLIFTGCALVAAGYFLLWLGPGTGFQELTHRAFAGAGAVLGGGVLVLLGLLLFPSG